MRQYTIEEQINGLQEFTTVSPQQFAIKNSILNTLNNLKALRNHVQAKPVSDSRLAATITAAIAKPTT